MEKIRMKIDQLSRREQLLSLAVMAVGIVFLFSFVLTPALKDLQAVRAQTEANHQAISQKEALLMQLRAQPKPDMLHNPNWAYYRENVGLSGIMRKISSLDQSQHGVRVVKITSQKVEKVGDHSKTGLQVEIEAPFNSLGGFIEELEKSRLVTRVDEVEISRIDRELQLCHARISLNSYTWREQ